VSSVCVRRRRRKGGKGFGGGREEKEGVDGVDSGGEVGGDERAVETGCGGGGSARRSSGDSFRCELNGSDSPVGFEELVAETAEEAVNTEGKQRGRRKRGLPDVHRNEQLLRLLFLSTLLRQNAQLSLEKLCRLLHLLIQTPDHLRQRAYR
jgi:hypothetical protein